MKLEFESDYRAKILEMNFVERCKIITPDDVQMWKDQWTKALLSWHSPYKALINCSNLEVQCDHPEVEEKVKQRLKQIVTFFEGFFLRKVAGYGFDQSKGHEILPFNVYESIDEAKQALGIRDPKSRNEYKDLRSQIHFDNHFKQHTIEVSFAQPVSLTSNEHLEVFKSKLLNNLMQWHTAWNLIIDCTNLEISREIHASFESMIKTMKGFFLKKVIGYSPKVDKELYPFLVYKARHKAAAALDSEGNFSGELANCSTRKVKKS